MDQWPNRMDGLLLRSPVAELPIVDSHPPTKQDPEPANGTDRRPQLVVMVYHCSPGSWFLKPHGGKSRLRWCAPVSLDPTPHQVSPRWPDCRLNLVPPTARETIDAAVRKKAADCLSAGRPQSSTTLNMHAN